MTSLSDLARKAGLSPLVTRNTAAFEQFAALYKAEVIAELCVDVEPVAWQHIQGEYVEASSRQLDDHELAHGWVQEPLYPATTVAALQARVAELEAKAAMIADIAHAGGLVLGEDLFAAMNMVRKLTIRDVHPSHTEGELRARVQVAIDEALRSKK